MLIFQFVLKTDKICSCETLVSTSKSTLYDATVLSSTAGATVADRVFTLKAVRRSSLILFTYDKPI
jgi:hypothetical protein